MSQLSSTFIQLNAAKQSNRWEAKGFLAAIFSEMILQFSTILRSYFTGKGTKMLYFITLNPVDSVY